MSKSIQSGQEKLCIGCRLVLPVGDFYPQGGIHAGKGLYFARCKRCVNQQTIDRRRNDERARSIQRAARARWRIRHPDKEKAAVIACSLNLTDGVVANFMGVRAEEVPAELLDCRREMMKLNRLIREYENK